MSCLSDIDLCIRLAGCSLATTPGKDNWIDQEGGLPEAICEMASDIRDSGKSTSSAIAIAVSQAKKLAATHPKYAKAVAQWEKMKASAHAKRAKNTVKAASSLGRLVVALSTGYVAPVAYDELSLDTESDVKTALEIFRDNRESYSSDEREQIMSRIKPAAIKFGVGGCGCGC